jgi:hypothetical protein
MGDNNNANNYEFVDDDTSQVEKVCKVYDSEDFFTIFVQLLLAFFALMSLWFKRQSERPKRKFKTWFLDVSKQGLGACYAHVLNMVSFDCAHLLFCLTNKTMPKEPMNEQFSTN